MGRRHDDAALDARDLLTKYRATRDYVKQHYYKWVLSTNQGYTDHGEHHVSAVIRTAQDLLAATMNNLTALDIFVLLQAIWWHDAGMAVRRSGHAERVAEITRDVANIGFPNDPVRRLVADVAKAHGHVDGLSVVDEEGHIATLHSQYKVRPRALAALVRFADEISETQSRVSAVRLQGINPDQRIYWEYAKAIVASQPEPSQMRVTVTMQMDSAKAAELYPCTDKCTEGHLNERGEISLIRYALCRLQKMNNERIYCASQFAEYAVIREINVRLRLYHQATGQVEPEPQEAYETEFTLGGAGYWQRDKRLPYPGIGIVNRFFEDNTAWEEQNLKKDLGL